MLEIIKKKITVIYFVLKNKILNSNNFALFLKRKYNQIFKSRILIKNTTVWFRRQNITMKKIAVNISFVAMRASGADRAKKSDHMLLREH